jgi:PAS domain S-box-containing protein
MLIHFSRPNFAFDELSAYIDAMNPADAIIEHIQEVFVEVDKSGVILAASSKATRIFRAEIEDVIGKNLRDAMIDASKAQQWAALEAAIAGNQATELAVFFPTIYVWYEFRIVPYTSSSSALLIRDVTDRQWLIRREAERVYLRAVFENAPIGLTVMRGPQLIVEYLNDFAKKLLENRRIEGLPLRDALPDLEQKEIFDIIETVYRTGEPWSASGVRVRFDRNGDGELEEGTFNLAYQPAKDFDGRVSGVVAISVECTSAA